MSEKTIVYRIQDGGGRGPYRPGFSTCWLDPERDGSDGTNPSVIEEFGFAWRRKILTGQACGCAFRSLEQLKSWFSSSEISRLLTLNFNIVELQADMIVAESKHQLIFARNLPLNIGAKIVTVEEAIHG